ncbi:putative protein phosphatase 2C 55 [Apostasia shenzhenica]|uniref:Protein phosphatase n=1 Tax=Apostasia shenzhenica TaxID=1088818 RepID=A0A2I0A2R3_9ASPA|nr:putative protein phosphatase 2C 55 [Apostasia shenzhenica]
MLSTFSCLPSRVELGMGELVNSSLMTLRCKTLPCHQVRLLMANTTYKPPSRCCRIPGNCHEFVNGLSFKQIKLDFGENSILVFCQRSRPTCIIRRPPLSCCSRSLHYQRIITGCLKNGEHWGKNMLYKCFWSDVSGSSWKSYNPTEPWFKNFSLASTPCSAGAAPHDVSLDGIPHGEQLENPGASSDRKYLGDRTLKLLSASCYLPHPEKEETGGEDAHFISNEQAIGVADGVGGWADLGVDAGQYARELMSHSVSVIAEEPKGSIDPARVLEKAYTCTKTRGSSTACIIALTTQGVHAVNLGDSGFIIVRDGCTVFRSPVQQHDFNFTYQLECGNASDPPSSAQVFTFPVMAGDVIVAGTDGLFDNLYDNEVTAEVVHAIRAGLGPQVTAQKIAALARQRAQDRNKQTPFSAAAQKAGYRYYGGKLDDITVVVSFVATSSS